MGMSEKHRELLEAVRTNGFIPASSSIVLSKILREDAQQQEKGDATKDRNITIHHIIEYKDREGSREATKTSGGNCPVEGFSEGWKDQSWDAEGTRPVAILARTAEIIFRHHERSRNQK